MTSNLHDVLHPSPYVKIYRTSLYLTSANIYAFKVPSFQLSMDVICESSLMSTLSPHTEHSNGALESFELDENTGALVGIT